MQPNPERVKAIAEPFQGSMSIQFSAPRVVTTLQPWASISERLRRIHPIQTEALRFSASLWLHFVPLCGSM
jgi:hypothetical protein